jgi:hypothetical protein
VSKLQGNGIAQQVALGLEYDWRPKEGFARGALAETLIPDLDLDRLGHWNITSTEGSTDRWEIVARATSELSGREILDGIGKALASQGKWTSAQTAPPASTPLGSAWTFRDAAGKPWTGHVTVQPDQAAPGQYIATLSIARQA